MTLSSSVSLSSAHGKQVYNEKLFLVLLIVCAIVTPTVTVLVNNGGNIALWVVSVTVLASLLAVSIIVILIQAMYIKRTKNNQKRYINVHNQIIT